MTLRFLKAGSPSSPARTGALSRSSRYFGLLLTVVMATWLLGCGPISVVHQAEVNALTKRPTVAVMPLDFDDIDIAGKTEAEYLDHIKPESRARFAPDKEAMNEAFLKELRGQAAMRNIPLVIREPQPGDLVLRPRVRFLEPGFWGGAVKAVTKVEVTIETEEQQATDVFVVKADSSSKYADRLGRIAPVFGALERQKTGGSRGKRMQICAKEAARLVGEYVQERIEKP